MAVYAPGTDFNDTVNTILYLRDCWAEGIKKYVTFHLFFHVSHTPKKVSGLWGYLLFLSFYLFILFILFFVFYFREVVDFCCFRYMFFVYVFILDDVFFIIFVTTLSALFVYFIYLIK